MSNNSKANKTWFAKLSDVFLREPQDREQLIDLLRGAQSNDILDADALSMIEGALQVSEMQVRDIMLPRAQIITIDKNSSLETCLPIMIDSHHSRFPVIDAERDEVEGILLAKDLLPYILNNKFLNLRSLLRPAIFIPESQRLDTLLKQFRSSRNHMAIVIDEYGHTAGLITIEDVLEQIVGEIEDEHDIDDENYVKQHDQCHYTVKALMPITEFNDYFSAQLDTNEFDTIGGLLMQHFGHVPQRDEEVVLDNYQFKILHADHRRIHVLQLVINS